MTLPLMGQTIYIESLYYPGWWIGASDRYNGELFQLSEVKPISPDDHNDEIMIICLGLSF